jgi:hypothetical protein
MAALRAAGQLPDGLRPVEFRRRIFDQGLKLGYSPSEIPSRTSIRRWLRKYKAAIMSNSSNETNDTLR